LRGLAQQVTLGQHIAEKEGETKGDLELKMAA